MNSARGASQKRKKKKKKKKPDVDATVQNANQTDTYITVCKLIER